MLGKLTSSASLGSSGSTEKVQKALMEDESFKKGMGEILTDEQKKNMKG